MRRTNVGSDQDPRLTGGAPTGAMRREILKPSAFRREMEGFVIFEFWAPCLTEFGDYLEHQVLKPWSDDFEQEDLPEPEEE